MIRITDSYLKSLKAQDKEELVLVDTGLYLRVTKSYNGHAAKKWLIRFMHDGKNIKFVFGSFPEIGLAEAKSKAFELMSRARNGENIVQAKKRENNPTATFRDVVNKWLETRTWEESHRIRQVQRLENTALRIFGDKPIIDVSIDDVDKAISLMTRKGSLESAYRTLVIIRAVFKYAHSLDKLGDGRILTKLETYKDNVPKPKTAKHLYSELSETQISELLRRIDSYVVNCRAETAYALKVLPYLLCRPGELCGASWEEIDFSAAEWRIPAKRMKMRRDHIVPLPTQAVNLFKELHKFTQHSFFCFPSWSKKENAEHLNLNTLIMCFRRMGYASINAGEGTPFTPHGFRGMGSTLLYQKLNYPGHLIELQLAHVDSNKVRAAYNQITARSWLDERREMLQKYANYLDGLKSQKG